MNNLDDKYNQMLLQDQDFKKVGWGSNESQVKRFEVLTQINDLSDSSILDVGCGLGGLLDYLKEIYTSFSYTGTDLNSEMIKLSKKRHPDIEFVKTDITSMLSKLKGRKFDYIFLSGALNLSADNHDQHIKKIMEVMYEMSIKGVAINFLSIFADYFSPGEYYANPEVILKLAFSITSKVILRHDYMNHDFTIYLYK